MVRGVAMRRLPEFYRDAAWLDPVPVERWMRTPSVRLTRQIMAGRMFPQTFDGLDEAMKMPRKGTLAPARH